MFGQANEGAEHAINAYQYTDGALPRAAPVIVDLARRVGPVMLVAPDGRGGVVANLVTARNHSDSPTPPPPAREWGVPGEKKAFSTDGSNSM